MKGKLIAIGLVVAVVVVLTVVFIAKQTVKKAAKKAVPAAVKPAAAKPSPAAKKQLSKGMGGLTVNITGIDKKDAYIKLKAFKADDPRSSIYAASFVSNTMQELLPGTYDVEINTTPQMIYKNIKVALDKVTVEDMGHVTGAVLVKALDDKKKEIRYSVRVLQPGTRTMLIAGFTNRPIEVVAGTYDITIETLPSQLKQGVSIEKGKKVEVNLEYASGTMSVNTADETNKEVRTMFRVRRSDNGDMIASGLTPKKLELLKGSYIVEVLTNPLQVKKDVAVNTGSETAVGFVVQPPPAKRTASAVKKGP